ncbi:phosphoglycerate kinase [Patescibacteria group bacterium]|nr:phosphoglycerate kinase [Patescibacteria group bacterium]MBU4274616.1 phosphoglycerate kinase [Patescibacteria group bacterium]MBU4367662.1 phosphoglycerate kinase [Patescibacteria group bacterium]MBU4461888.1 phosphoglycerate kinase [Patescibacteria group bacterium]MCG2699981.1 phosphoglycerate kinase [Candidatus Parcubacteria bacterium]
MKTVRDFNVKNKRVLVRCDFNVPLDEQGNILNDFRIRQTIPTIKYLLKEKAKIILMSHLGNPEGEMVPELQMDKIQERLIEILEISEHLDVSITKTPSCKGYEIEKYIFGLEPSEILLLENLRFYKEETDNDPEFAKSLSRLGDIYINDAFGVCHRSHASVVGVPQYLPCGIGFLIEKEIQNLERLLKNPKKPMIALIGGKKVGTKSKVIDKILEVADFVLISGLIKEEIEKTGMVFKYPEKLIGPVDSIICEGKGLDIGPKTIKLFKKKIRKAKTIFWNGPFGMTEKEEFQKGTFKIAKAIARKWFCFSVAGGGETIEFLNRKRLISKFDHVSTGGGAMLSFIAGEPLPGLEALRPKG